MAEALSADLRDERSAALKRRKVLDEGRDRKLEANVDELCRATKEWTSELRNTNEQLYDKLADTEEELVKTSRYLRDKEEELVRTHRYLLDKEEELVRTHRYLLDKEEELTRVREDLFMETQKTRELKSENLWLRNILTDKNDTNNSSALRFLGTTHGMIVENEQSENNRAKKLKNDDCRLYLADKNERSDSTVMGSPDTTPSMFLQKEQSHDNLAITYARSDNEDEFAKSAVGAGGGGRLAFYNHNGDVKSSSAQMHLQGASGGDGYMVANKERALVHEVGMRVCELCHVKVHLNDFENHRQGRKHKHRCALMGA